MAASSSSGGDTVKEYSVMVPKATNMKYSIMKFNPANNVDFTKCEGAKIERENNLKQYKVANDIDVVPQFGAGSEFGREQREEARRKKYGISKKSYNPEDQPWLLHLATSGRNTRKFKGVKEGGVTENASYFVFKQTTDGAFEAFPVEEWYNFTPVAKYKSLNADEAEEEFSRRDKTLNYFSVMVKKRLGKEEQADVDDAEPKTKTKKGKNKDFLLTEMDEWAILSDSDDDAGSGQENKDEQKPTKKSKKTKVRKLAKKKGSDDEAEEESDDMDEGREVDYITDTDSEDEEMYTDNVKTDKYEATGVEDAEGLRKIIESDEEEETKKEEDEQEEDEMDEEEEKPKKDSDSGESSSDSDSDLDKDDNIVSALFMQRKEKKKSASKESSRSNTPTVDDKGQKRKGGETDSPAAKKSRTASPVPSASSSAPSTPVSTLVTSTTSTSEIEGVTEEMVKRYLMRKPMTTKDLLQKLVSKNSNVQRDKLVAVLGSMLKKLNPEKRMIKDKLHLFMKEDKT